MLIGTYGVDCSRHGEGSILMSQSALFSKFNLRSLTFKNRIGVSPMCMYSSEAGYANRWHLVHLGARAVGGAALVMTEATAVLPEGRITPQDLGIWSDDHIPMLSELTSCIHEHGAIAGIQLAHAGRKASTARPWEGRALISPADGGWEPVAPSPLSFITEHPLPHALTLSEIKNCVVAFKQAAIRALAAGFKVLEIHGAHGYLINAFLSPRSNQRSDCYGGSLENRMRFCCEIVSAVRSVWPDAFPLFLRISATDWCEGGWDVAQSIVLAEKVKSLGVDLIDVSSGGNEACVNIPFEPGYQVGFSESIRNSADICTSAVGLITEPSQADEIITSGQSDFVFIGRALLRDPYWPMKAANILNNEIDWPNQYLRAKK